MKNLEELIPFVGIIIHERRFIKGKSTVLGENPSRESGALYGFYQGVASGVVIMYPLLEIVDALAPYINLIIS